MRIVLRILAAVCVAFVVLAGAVRSLSSFLDARADLQAHSPMQSEKKVALAGRYGAVANATDAPGSAQVATLLFEPKALALNTEPTIERPVKRAPIVVTPQLPAPAPAQIAGDVPLPLPRPLPAAPEIAMAVPSVAPRAQARNGAFALPDVDSRTAIYDISARTVYLPGGRKLEAHSGLGDKMDNPRYVGVKNRGPTPPNVYNLTLREQPFHGVRAIRMTPIDDNNMFGRDGILAHSYMLGPSGQSNGCVSFSDYAAFLRAYMNGEVERMVVVARLPKSSAPALMSMRQENYRYATNSY